MNKELAGTARLLPDSGTALQLHEHLGGAERTTMICLNPDRVRCRQHCAFVKQIVPG